VTAGFSFDDWGWEQPGSIVYQVFPWLRIIAPDVPPHPVHELLAHKGACDCNGAPDSKISQPPPPFFASFESAAKYPKKALCNSCKEYGLQPNPL
jgi:hypothetical protein